MKIFLRNITALLIFFVIAIFVAEKSRLSIAVNESTGASVATATLALAETNLSGYVSKNSSFVFNEGPFVLENNLKDEWTRGDEWQTIRLKNATTTVYEKTLTEADGPENYIFGNDYSVKSDGSAQVLFEKRLKGLPDGCLLISEIKDEKENLIPVPISCGQSNWVIQNGENREIFLLGYDKDSFEMIEYSREGNWKRVPLLMNGLKLKETKSIRLIKPWDDGYDRAVVRGTAEGGPAPRDFCINLTEVDVCSRSVF